MGVLVLSLSTKSNRSGIVKKAATTHSAPRTINVERQRLLLNHIG